MAITTNSITTGKLNGNVNSYYAVASTTDDLGAQIQAIHDAMPLRGGRIVIPANPNGYVWNTAVVITKPVWIYGQSHKAAGIGNAGTLPSVTSIYVADGITALTIGDGGANFSGVRVSDLLFRRAAAGTGTSTVIAVNNVSHCLFRDITITGFTSGVGMEFTGNSGQYSRIESVFIHGTLIGIRATDYNGVSVTNCYIDPANNQATPLAGSIGIHITNNSADTWDINGTQIQGAETLIDTSGAMTKIRGLRGEIFTTGVILRGLKQMVGNDCNFSNFIYNSSGVCVDIQNTASYCIVSPFAYGSVSSEPVRDAGTNTVRADALKLERVVDLINTTTEVTIGHIPAGMNPSHYIRNAKFYVGNTAQTASGVNYWAIQLRIADNSAYVGGSANSQSGWTAGSTINIPTARTDSNNNVVNGTLAIKAIFTKTGTPADLTNCVLSLNVVPY